jgi:TolA-binding protein
MSPNRKEEIIKQFVDLEEFGEELFALSAPAPSMTKKSKKIILRSIVGGKHWNVPQLTLFTTASAFAAFAFIFGFAQMTSAPHFLHSLRITKPTVQEVPNPQQVQQVQQQLIQQQSKIEELQKTGAPAADIEKAVDDLNSSVKKTENSGYKVIKITDKSGRTYISVKLLQDRHGNKSSGDSSGEKDDSFSETGSDSNSTTSH